MRLAQRMTGGALLAAGVVIFLAGFAPNVQHPAFQIGAGAVLATIGCILASEGCEEEKP